MPKLIVVCGATGSVGGSVAWRMVKEGWKVRAITRNKDSNAAKALADAGVELDCADYDDVPSLTSAFRGASAVFGVTNIFEYLTKVGPDAAAKREKQQLVNIAEAANGIPSLKHLILHTLPGGERLGGSGRFVPHMDGKDQAADEIKKSLPEVARITTFLWIGFFTSNFYDNPMLKPVELPNSGGAHVYIQPASPALHLYFAGDIATNIGVFVLAILENPLVSQPAKYAFLYTSQGSFQDYLQAWVNVTGRRATFVQTSLEQYEQLWGPFGKEIGLMFEAFDGVSDWTTPYRPDVVTADDLGIPQQSLVDLEPALKQEKNRL